MNAASRDRAEVAALLAEDRARASEDYERALPTLDATIREVTATARRMRVIAVQAADGQILGLRGMRWIHVAGVRSHLDPVRVAAAVHAAVQEVAS